MRGLNEGNDAVGLLHAELATHMSREGLGVGSSVNGLLIAATLSVKNEAKVSAVRLIAGGGGGQLSRVLKVEISFQVSVVL